jgi:hypothetical protein
MTVSNTQNYWVFGPLPSLGILENRNTTCLHKFFPPFLCIGAHALGFVSYVCSTNFYLLFYPS